MRLALKHRRSRRGPSLLYSLAVQAAIDGAGVLIGHESLVSAAVASGALVAPFAERVPSKLSLEILAPDRLPVQATQAIEWLRSQV